ncbi:YihY/virulence factor BrkB family protein [Halobaculum litoreum]|uniref:YihY/virulence factor BrkB family protein n=1 Tax=Halobaculum litoreum TaxID=3031998 RepID=UPI0024C41A22|nr:YhjD/YihY/BrkB family envelope integrity protein [Halobaculum sp. DT92]
MSGDSRDTADDRTAPVGAAATVVAVARALRRADATFVAGSLAYYSIVAVLPVAVLAVALVAAVGGRPVAAGAVAAGGDLLTERGRTFLRGSLGDVADRRGIAVVAGLLVCFSVVQLFRGLDRAFAAVYRGDERGILSRLRDTLFAFGVGALGVAAVVVAGGALSLYANESLVRVAVPATVFALSAVALFPLFYALPAAEVTRTEVVPGTVVAAAGWTLTGAVVARFAGGAGRIGIYGAIGGLVVLVTWFYAANLLVLVGAATNAVLAGRA